MVKFAIACVLVACAGCSPATANSPREGLYPMWADCTCWSAKDWQACAAERKLVGVREGHFVAARVARAH